MEWGQRHSHRGALNSLTVYTGHSSGKREGSWRVHPQNSRCLARMFCPLHSETLFVPQGWTLEASLGVTPLV